MTTQVNMTLSNVMSTQQQLQKVKIARDCAENLMGQFVTYGEQEASQERLRLVIKQLRLVEADLCDVLGFTETATKLRGVL